MTGLKCYLRLSPATAVSPTDRRSQRSVRDTYIKDVLNDCMNHMSACYARAVTGCQGTALRSVVSLRHLEAESLSLSGLLCRVLQARWPSSAHLCKSAGCVPPHLVCVWGARGQTLVPRHVHPVPTEMPYSCYISLITFLEVFCDLRRPINHRR